MTSFEWGMVITLSLLWGGSFFFYWCRGQGVADIYRGGCTVRLGGDDTVDCYPDNGCEITE